MAHRVYEDIFDQSVADNVTLNSNIRTNLERMVVNHNVNAAGPIYCFFRIPYTSKVPLPGPFSLRTYELANHHPLGTGLGGAQRDGNLVKNLRQLM